MRRIPSTRGAARGPSLDEMYGVRQTMFGVRPQYLPSKPLHQRVDSEWPSRRLLDHKPRPGPHIRSMATVSNKRPPAEGPRRRSVCASDSTSASVTKMTRPGGVFGRLSGARFAPLPEKPARLAEESRDRPMTVAEFRRHPPGALPAPAPDHFHAVSRFGVSRFGPRGSGGKMTTKGDRWEQFELHHSNHSKDAAGGWSVPNEHMNRFPGYGREGPSRHRRNSTTPHDRRVDEGPRAKLRRSVYKLSAVAALAGGGAFELDDADAPSETPAETATPADSDALSHAPAGPLTDPLLYDAPGEAGRSLFANTCLLDRVQRPII